MRARVHSAPNNKLVRRGENDYVENAQTFFVFTENCACQNHIEISEHKLHKQLFTCLRKLRRLRPLCVPYHAPQLYYLAFLTEFHVHVQCLSLELVLKFGPIPTDVASVLPSCMS